MERRDANPARGYPTRARRRAALLVAGALFTRIAFAEGNESKLRGADEIEHTIIVGVGGATELELHGGLLHPGANLMLEWDAVENWLELEVEASVLSADGGIEVPVGVLVY